MRKIFAPLLAAASLAGIIVLVSNHKPDTEDRRVSVNLNRTLTNGISDTSSLAGLDKNIETYMQYWHLKGLSLSIMRNDSLVYAKGYGWADEEEGIRMSPGHILRLASVSKLITATGIMKLQEEGRLTLQDHVFGPDGILCDSIFTASIKDKNYFKINVEHLLRHKAGFTTNAGDPMFSTRDIIYLNHLSSPPDHETLVRTQLKKRLPYEPGTSQAYSNFGYLLLSMVIEKITGESYENWIQNNILLPAGCMDFHIAENYYEGRYCNESKYYVQDDDEPVKEYNNSGRMVVRCYGGNDIKALAGAGAWVGSAAELARFVASIDGRPEVPDILTEESIREMTRYIDPDTYSLGWNDTKETGEWTRSGTMSGTCALIKYFPDGECWILITNTSTWKGPGHTRYDTELFKKSRAGYSALLPARDFFNISEEELQ
ncbi:MAG: serine hydrolase domain-containing protein [Bacteroidia bacterium]|nr:serine hydrolase domain-containing protein [Bacteroidia bacterium]